MVNETDLRPIVQKLVDAYPSLANWLSGLSITQRETMRASWVRQVAKLEPQDVQAAADGILDGKTPLPKNYEFDRLGYELRTWGNVAAAARIEVENADRLREQARPSGDRTASGIAYRCGKAMKCAACWGSALRSELVTEDEHTAAMETIHKHHMTGAVDLVWPSVPGEDRKSLVDFWQSKE